MSGRFTGYTASLAIATVGGEGSAASADFKQLDSWRFSPNGVKSFLTPAGLVDRQHVAQAQAEPMYTLTTRDLATWLALVSTAQGNAVRNADSDEPGARFRFQERQCSGVFSNATKYAMHSYAGYIKPTTLTASQDDTDGALLTLEYYSISKDGVTDPDVKIEDATTPAAPAFVSRYFFGPVYYDGVLVEQIDSLSIDFGINSTTQLFSNVYPTCYAVETRTPSVTLTGTKQTLNALISQFINPISATDGTLPGFTFHLRQAAEAGTRVPYSQNAHIKISLTAGEWCVDDSSWSGTDDSKLSVRIEAVGALFGLDRSSTIPTQGEDTIPGYLTP